MERGGDRSGEGLPHTASRAPLSTKNKPLLLKNFCPFKLSLFYKNNTAPPITRGKQTPERQVHPVIILQYPNRSRYPKCRP